MKSSEWDQRIRRAVELGERFSYAAEVLAFYRQILEFQSKVYRQISLQPLPGNKPDGPLRDRVDVDVALRHLPALLSFVERSGPSKLAEQARHIDGSTLDWQRQRMEEFLSPNQASAEQPDNFFARVLLQPYAEYLAEAEPPRPAGSAGSVCPTCKARPQAAVLRPEGDGGKRFLLCSLCLTEWEFRRILCPICGEERLSEASSLFGRRYCRGAGGSLRHLPLLPQVGRSDRRRPRHSPGGRGGNRASGPVGAGARLQEGRTQPHGVLGGVMTPREWLRFEVCIRARLQPGR